MITKIKEIITNINKLHNLSTILYRLEQRIIKTEIQVEEVRQDLDDINISEIENNIEQISRDLDDKVDGCKYDELDDKIDDAERDINDLEENFDDLSTDFNRLQEDLIQCREQNAKLYECIKILAEESKIQSSILTILGENHD